MSDRKEQGEERKTAPRAEEDRKERIEDLEPREEHQHDVKGGKTRHDGAQP